MKKKLLGTLTDGDIRRAVLNGIDFSQSIKKVFNKRPFYLFEGDKKNKSNLSQSLLKNYKVIPVVNKKKKILKIFSLNLNNPDIKNLKSRFKNFNTPQEAVNHLVNQWHKDYRGYSGVNNASNANAAALKLKSEGYATDPDYAQSLQRLMREYSNIRPKQSKPKITPKTRDKNNQASVLNTTMGEEGTTTIMVLRQPVIVG